MQNSQLSLVSLVSCDFSGSPDTVRVWNVDSGNPTSRMTTGRSERHKETIVWSVAFCGHDLKIMTGDSRGKTCFWNGRTGTLLDAYQTHKADVLTVAVTKPPSAAEAFSAGVDPLVVHFRPVPRKDGCDEKWVKSIHRSVHSHDVRAIVAAGRHVFSAGVDATIAVTDMAAKTVLKLPPIPHGQCVAMAKEAEVVVLRQPKCLEVWRLGQPPETTLSELVVGSVCPLNRDPVKVLQLVSKDDETIRCCGVSTDAIWMAYASSTRFRVYAVSGVTDSRPVVHRANIDVNNDQDEVQLPHHIRFFHEEKKTKGKCSAAMWSMVTATEKGKLQVFTLTADATTPAATLKFTVNFTKAGVSHLEVKAKFVNNACHVSIPFSKRRRSPRRVRCVWRRTSTARCPCSTSPATAARCRGWPPTRGRRSRVWPCPAPRTRSS
jgi:U3 small nucleolar RNA-associated protein 4